MKMSSEFWSFCPSKWHWNLFHSNSYQNRLINSIGMNNLKKSWNHPWFEMLYNSYLIWTFSLPSLTEKRNSTTYWIKLLCHHKPIYSNIHMCSKKTLNTSSGSLYIDLLTPLTLNKQRYGIGTGTINSFTETLLILYQEVEVWIPTMHYIFKPIIKSYTSIASAVGVSFMSTQMSCKINWYDGEWG